MSTPQQAKSMSTDSLVASLRQVADDAEELLRASAGVVGKEVAGVRARVAESVTTARWRLRQTEGRLADRARIAALVTDRYVRRNPWKAIGIVSTAALLVGAVLRSGVGRKPTE